VTASNPPRSRARSSSSLVTRRISTARWSAIRFGSEHARDDAAMRGVIGWVSGQQHVHTGFEALDRGAVPVAERAVVEVGGKYVGRTVTTPRCRSPDCERPALRLAGDDRSDTDPPGSRAEKRIVETVRSSELPVEPHAVGGGRGELSDDARSPAGTCRRSASPRSCCAPNAGMTRRFHGS